jgi:lysophospholipase L1-like esterase
MKYSMRIFALSFLLLGTSLAVAQTAGTTTAATDTSAPPQPGAPSSPVVYQPGPADVPSVNHPTGQRHLLGVHAKYMKRIQEDNKIQLLFLGDSITFNWYKAPDVWNKYFGQWDTANFGDGGSYTQHLLWRITNGELDGISPKVIVLLIGINNLYHKPGNTPEDTAVGIKKILDTIHTKCPNTKVLLLGLFPYRQPDSPVRTSIRTVNSIISKYDDGQKTRYLGLWDQFLQPDGTISKAIMPDGLHPSPAGYEILAKNMQPLLQEMMQ